MSARDYLDFDLQIDEVADGGYRARVLHSPVGQAEESFDLPFSALEIENFILRVGRPRRGVRRINSPEMNEARKFGSRLYDAVFQGGLQSCLLRSIDYATQQERGVRLRLRLPPSLIELPWEYLYDTTYQRFLAHSTGTPIVRYVELPQTLKPLAVTPPLKVLVMIATPSDYEPLDVEAEWQKIKTAVQTLEQNGLLQLTRLPVAQGEGATLAALQKQLRREHYHILHFIGHGGFDAQTQDGVLLFQAEDGRSRLVGGNYLGTLLHDHPSLRLVLLNACEGARTSKSDPFAGVTQQLMRQGIPAVIAMQFEITDTAAILLAREFYDALVSGYPVDGALAEARKALFTTGNDIEWGTPVLYLRATDGHLFDVAAQPSSFVLSAHRPDMAAERAAERSKTRTPTAAAESINAKGWQRWGALLLLVVLLVVAGFALWTWLETREEPHPTATLIASSVSATDAPATQEGTPGVAPPPSTPPAVSSLDPLSRTIWLDEAENAIDEENYPAAREMYERLLAANPEDIDALRGLARTVRRLGSNAEALRILDQAIKLAPADPYVNYALGQLYAEAFDDNPRALDYLATAIETGTPALRRDIYAYRANLYKSIGEYSKAVADMNEVITTNSNSDDFVQRARLYQAWGNEKAAKRDFTTAIERAPNVGKYHLYRADFYAQFNRVEQALADYGSFLKLRDPDEIQSVINKAETYIRLHSAAPTPTLAAGTIMTNAIDGARYVYVPAGPFIMGLDEGGFDEKPQHEVELDAFWIMQTEVTNEQYEKCVQADICTLPFNPTWGTDEFWAKYDQHPVTYVTWEQATVYAEWAGGRLPTEAEWEKAARGMDGRLYPWGSQQPTAQRLNFDKQIGEPQPVGRYPDGASPYGALDMAGNVWEWVIDWYDPDYYYTSPSENPTGPPTGERRVLRGGAYDSPASDVGSYYREGGGMSDKYDDSGFRVVQEVVAD
jgi:formylglycine-generating enzyme required for sulfatase activity/Tfp pilus assembly protein PilF